MKGKKFDAAQAHFEKKRLQYDKTIKYLRDQLENAHRDCYTYKSQRDFAEREVEELKKWVERLLEYTELSKDDIKAVCEKDKKMADAVTWLQNWGGMAFFGGRASELKYTPTCPRGYTDCIRDPAYIKFNYPDWYKDLYRNKTPEEAASGCRERVREDPNEEYYCYDNEDK